MAPRKTTTNPKKKTPAKKPKTRTKAGSQARAVKKIQIDENTKLLAMEQRFADEFLKDLNQTQAAIRAGYSPKGAARQAHVLKKQPNVAAYIARKLAEQSTRTGIEFERIMREAGRIAFANPLKVMNPKTGEMLTVTDDDAAAIQGIKHKPGEFGTEREIKFHAKDKALDLILKYGRISVEFEAKMAVEKEKLAIQREQLELEKRRLAIQEAQAAQEKDGFNKIISIIDPFGDNQIQQKHMESAEKQGDISETDNKSTNSGGEPV